MSLRPCLLRVPRGGPGGGAGERRPQLLDRKLGWCWLRLGARTSARRPGSVERAEVVPAGPWGLRRPGRARGWSPALGRTLPGSLGGALVSQGPTGALRSESVPPSGVPLDKEMEITPARGLTRMWPGGARSWAPVWGGRLGVLGRGEPLGRRRDGPAGPRGGGGGSLGAAGVFPAPHWAQLRAGMGVAWHLLPSSRPGGPQPCLHVIGRPPPLPRNG